MNIKMLIALRCDCSEVTELFSYWVEDACDRDEMGMDGRATTDQPLRRRKCVGTYCALPRCPGMAGVKLSEEGNETQATRNEQPRAPCVHTVRSIAPAVVSSQIYESYSSFARTAWHSRYGGEAGGHTSGPTGIRS